jgi:AraC-like DNA-binding protein
MTPSLPCSWQEATGTRYRYLRGADVEDVATFAEVPSLVFALEGSILEVCVAGHDRPFLLDRAAFLLLPAHARAQHRRRSAVVEVLHVSVENHIVRHTLDGYRKEMDASRLQAVLSTPQLLPCTRWVHELAHRYLFERHRCEKHRSLATRFLEVELVKETYYLAVEALERNPRITALAEGEGLVERARTIIERELCERMTVRELARRCGASESTLLRAFQQELGTTPAAYVRDRRLDEAAILLKSGRLSVGEIAERIGYGSFAAFSHAFRRRFGVTPREAGQVHARGRAPAMPPKA